MITIAFNGQSREFARSLTVLELLTQNQVDSRFCAVELNEQIVPKTEFDSQQVVDGDQVEVVTLVGGG
jgi:sulfur carrier protein